MNRAVERLKCSNPTRCAASASKLIERRILRQNFIKGFALAIKNATKSLVECSVVINLLRGTDCMVEVVAYSGASADLTSRTSLLQV